MFTRFGINCLLVKPSKPLLWLYEDELEPRIKVMFL